MAIFIVFPLETTTNTGPILLLSNLSLLVCWSGILMYFLLVFLQRVIRYLSHPHDLSHLRGYPHRVQSTNHRVWLHWQRADRDGLWTDGVDFRQIPHCHVNMGMYDPLDDQRDLPSLPTLGQQTARESRSVTWGKVGQQYRGGGRVGQ